MSNELIAPQGDEPITTPVADASSYREAEWPDRGTRIVDVPFLPAFFHGQDAGSQADRSGWTPAPTCLFRVQVHLVTGLLPPSSTLTLVVHTSTVTTSEDESQHDFEVSFSRGRPPGYQAEVPSGSFAVSNPGLVVLHASVLQEQHLFHLRIHQPLQAARMWCSNLLDRVHLMNQNARRMVARAQACVLLATLLVCFSTGRLLGGYRSSAPALYVVCEAYIVWTLYQLENVTAPRLAVFRGWERRLTIISHSLTSIQLSADGIHLQSSHILRFLVMAIACQPGSSPSPSWTTRMNRMLLNYEERGLDLASQMTRLAGLLLATGQI